MLDNSLQQDLVAIATRAGKCKLQLLDAGDKAIVTQTFQIPSTVASFGNDRYRRFCKLDLGGIRDEQLVLARGKLPAQIAQIFIVNSVFLTSHYEFEHLPVISSIVSLTLGLDELKSVEGSKVEITFDE